MKYSDVTSYVEDLNKKQESLLEEIKSIQVELEIIKEYKPTKINPYGYLVLQHTEMPFAPQLKLEKDNKAYLWFIYTIEKAGHFVDLYSSVEVYLGELFEDWQQGKYVFKHNHCEDWRKAGYINNPNDWENTIRKMQLAIGAMNGIGIYAGNYLSMINYDNLIKDVKEFIKNLENKKLV